MHIEDAIKPPGAQRSPLWFQQRIGKLTASNMKDAVSYLKGGQSSHKRKDLIDAIVCERLTDELRQVFVNDAMRWGTENEDDAKDAFFDKTGLVVEDAPFVEHPTIEYFGASPDGYIENNGLIEIKCPTTTTYLGWLRAGIVPPEHEPQMLAQLACTRRKYVMFCAYDPRMKKGPKLFIRRYEPKPEQIEWIEDEARKLLAEVETAFDEAVMAA